MANRSGRQVPTEPFAPGMQLPGNVPQDLGNIPRAAGELGDIQAKSFHELADKVGKFADEAATIEGDRAGKVAGLDENYRPTGDVTLRGRAFEEAATKIYQNNLDASLRTDMQQAYELNKDSPGALKGAFDKLHADYQQNHVFPDIAGDFQASFTRLRLPYEKAAGAKLEEKTKDEEKASLLTNVDASLTNAARLSAGNPNDPATSAAVGAELKRVEGLYDEAAANGTITASSAAKLKIDARNDMVSRAALSQANDLKTPEDVLAMRAALRDKFARGDLKNLNADGFDSLDSKLDQLARQKRAQSTQAEGLLKKNVDDYVGRAIDGLAVSPQEWSRLNASEGAASPKGQQILDAGQKQMQLGNILRNRSIEDGQTIVARLRQDLQKKGNITSGEADLLDFAEKYVKDQRTAINTDQLGLAAKKNIIPALSPVDFQGFAASTDPAAAGDLAAQIRARTAQAHAVASDFQRAPQFLRPEEKARLKDIVEAGGDKALKLAGAIVAGAGTDAPAVLKEIGVDAPLLTAAGDILVNGGSMQAARDVFTPAAMRMEKLKVGHADSTLFEAAIRDSYGDAFTSSIDAGSRAHAAARAIAETRITKAGLDPKAAPVDLYRRAAQEAAGAVYVDGEQFGGVTSFKPPNNWMFGSHQVLVPAGVKADKFRDVIGALTDADLKALKVPPLSAGGPNYTADTIKSARPVAVRGGYSFAMGTVGSDDPQWIRGADGQHFVLPFEQLAGVLRQRVPAAFLGVQ